MCLSCDDDADHPLPHLSNCCTKRDILSLLLFMQQQCKNNPTEEKDSLTSSILVAQIRKPPDIAEPNAESHLGQKVLNFTVPSCTSGRLRGVRLSLLTSEAINRQLYNSGLFIVSGQRLLLHLRRSNRTQTWQEQVSHYDTRAEISHCRLLDAIFSCIYYLWSQRLNLKYVEKWNVSSSLAIPQNIRFCWFGQKCDKVRIPALQPDGELQ